MEENVERITSKILEDAENKADDIVSGAQNDADEKVDVARRKGEATKSKILTDAEKAVDQIKRKTVAESKIKARTIILESKEKLIEKVFAAAQEKLEKLSSDKDYPKILRNMAKDSCVELGGGELKVTVRKEDEAVLAKEMKSLEKEVKEATGKTTKLALSTEDIGPGVVVHRSDGKVGIDSTFQNRLELLRPLVRLKVAEAMFS